MERTRIANGAEPSAATWSAVRRDLDTLRTDIVKLGERSLTDGQEKVTEEAQRLKTVLAELVARVEIRSRSSWEGVSEYVTRRPVTSLAAAFGSGLILALLSGRRR